MAMTIWLGCVVTILIAFFSNDVQAFEKDNDNDIVSDRPESLMADGEVLLIEPQSKLMKLMQDAKVDSVKYLINTTFETDYQITEVNVTIVDPETDTRLTFTKPDQKGLFYSLSFEHAPLVAPVAVFHIKYGPEFLFSRHAEAICVMPFSGAFIFDNVRCDSLSTAQYLIAATMLDTPFADILNDETVLYAQAIKALPFNNITYQYYLAVHKLLLDHVAESNSYLVGSQPGQYLSTIYPVFQALRQFLFEFRQFDVALFDDVIAEQDPSMVNIGYRIYMSLDVNGMRYLSSLRQIGKSTDILKQFFSGQTSFDLATPEANVVPNLVQVPPRIDFLHWPWFETIQVRFDNSPPFQVPINKLSVAIPPDVEIAVLHGQSLSGRFSRSRLSVNEHVETNDNLLDTP